MTETPNSEPPTISNLPSALEAEHPEQVGPYRILSVLGEGGMGTVYLAEQTEPMRRRVALKLIKPGMDSRAVLARFEQERQALAVMDHPCVAKILDGGTVPVGTPGAGRPYFAMEYVKGVPITEHCDTQRLGLEERLALFIRVCEAVQHAHQKGIIHRDIKPSNILVTYEGQQAVPKIIDFGVAKALDQRLSERTIFTEQGQLIGTPEYMSPEQAEMSGQDIDTRADVYSLGVILYELLTGVLPFDRESLRAAAFAEIQRIIREIEPPKPSTKLSSLQHVGAGVSPAVAAEPEAQPREPSSIDEVARKRHSDPRTLVRKLRGDLDWIVMRCLEKDRARRYETATGLAEDIRRHLNHEPVLAGPPSAAYRVRKFVRRNRGPVLAASLVTLTLLAGLMGTATFALREAQQRKLAEQNERRAKENEALAVKRADETKQVAEFQASMLSGIDAEQMGRTIVRELRKQVQAGLERTWVETEDGQMRKRTVDEIAAGLAQFDAGAAPANPSDVARQMMDISVLTPAAAAISEEFADQAEVQADLLDTLAGVYESLGQYDQAEPHLRRALDLRRRLRGDEHPHVAVSLNNLAEVLRVKGDYAAAEPLYRQALAIDQTAYGDEHPAVATNLNNLALLLRAKGDYAAAERLFREALAIDRKAYGNESSEVATSADNLADLLRAKGDYGPAEPLSREALALRRKLLGDEHPHVAAGLSNLAALLRDKGDYAAAEPLFREALALRRKLLGDAHPAVAASLSNLAGFLWRKGDYAAAEPLAREGLALYRELLGDEHPYVATSLNDLAGVLTAKGDYAAAELLCREALTLRRKLLGDGHPDVAASLNSLAYLLNARGNYAGAERLYREALALRRKLLGDEHPAVANSLNNLAALLGEKGDYPAAERLYRETLAVLRKAHGDEHPDVALSVKNLALLLHCKGDRAAAEPLYREAVALNRRLLGDEHPRLATSLHCLAWLLLEKGDYAAAEPLFREALAIDQNKLPPSHADTANSRASLGQVLTKLGRYAEAEALLLAAQETLAQTRTPPQRYVGRCLEGLVELYDAWHAAEPEAGHETKAAEWRAKLEQWRAATQPATTRPATTQPAASPPGA